MKYFQYFMDEETYENTYPPLVLLMTHSLCVQISNKIGYQLKSNQPSDVLRGAHGNKHTPNNANLDSMIRTLRAK